MDRILEMEKEPGILARDRLRHPALDGHDRAGLVDGGGGRRRPGLAQARADELAMMLWERRERFLVQKTPIKEVIETSLASEQRPVVVTDSSDSVSGGGYGDGNLLLKALLEMGYADTALLTITDPEAVAACFPAGVGAEITIPIGGKLTPTFYQPVTVTGPVKLLTDGKFMSELPPMPVDNGRTAVFQVGGISIVLSEQQAVTIDREVYHSSGLEPPHFKIVQVKSPGGFRAIYGLVRRRGSSSWTRPGRPTAT